MNTDRKTIKVNPAKRAILSFARRVITDQRGQTLPFVALMVIGLLGVSGIVVDLGHAYVVQSELQNTANAAALAAAGYVYTSSTDSVNTSTMATKYCAGATAENPYTAATVACAATTKCLNMLMPKGTTCVSGSAPNAVVVKTSVAVKTFFMGLFGVPKLNVGATATASMQGTSQPWNVAIVIDSTGSMATVDSNCGGLTEFQCALSGTQALLESTNPCPTGLSSCSGDTAHVRMALFTFPNVLTAVNGALPVVNGVTADSIKDDIACSGTPGTYSTPSKQPIAAPYTLPKPGATLLTYGGTGGAAARSTYQTGLPYLTYSNTVGSTTTTWEATYQITPFLSDFYAPSAASGLNSSSALVQAVGYGSTKGCLTYTLGIDGSTGNGSGFGNTYFASSIYEAQASLIAEQKIYGGNNAIIFLSDGQANLSEYAKNSSAYGTANSTNQYADASGFPEAPAGSEVGPSTTSYPVPSYYTPAKILAAQNTLAYDTLSSTSSATGQTRSGTSQGIYPDWYDQCQQAIVAAQYAAKESTTVFAVAYGSESSGCSNGWSVGATDTTKVANGTNQNFTTISQLLPCTTMENIASSWSNFYSDNQQTGNVNLGCTDDNHSTVSLQDIFQAIAATFTTPRLIPNNAT
jgi:Flp pilus assembly protein TadG